MSFLLTRFNRWRYSASLTLQALVITGAAGVFFWFVQDQLYTKYLHDTFIEHLLNRELEESAHHDWRQLDEQLRAQERAAQILINQVDFVQYVADQERLEWSEVSQFAVVHHQERPRWLPARSILRGFVFAAHVVLADGGGRVRESYSIFAKPLPDTLLDGVVEGCMTELSVSNIWSWQGVPHLMTCVVLRDQFEDVRAVLVFSLPMDDDFLLSFQFAQQTNGVRILLDSEGTHVSASSRPDLIPDGTPVDQLVQDYLMFGKAFFDYGYSSDVFVHFASLIPKTQLDALTHHMVLEGRKQRAIGHFLMIIIFLMITYWVGGRMRVLTRQMMKFAQEHFDLEISVAKSSNPLQQVMEQFAILAKEIEEIRKRESDSATQLISTNRALESSLTLVKRTYVQLLATEKMASLGGLVAGVAHEINTPVGIGVTAASFLEGKTKKCLEQLAAGTLSRQDLEGYLQDAEESSGMILSNLLRAADLVRSFKQVAVDTSSEACRLFEFLTVIHQILQSLHPRLKKSRHKVTVNCSQGLVYFGRPDVFSQIITNFVLNSLQHGFVEGQAGEIVIEVSKQETEFCLRYADNGQGMGEADRLQIFEPFFTTARNKGGSGLGMHIVFNLVTSTLGGQIQCSTLPGEGISFIITFPLVREIPDCNQVTGEHHVNG